MKNQYPMSFLILFCFGMFFLAPTFSKEITFSYAQMPVARTWVQSFSKEHQLDEKKMLSLLSKVQKNETVLKRMLSPAESNASWKEYKHIFLPKRIEGGKKFLKQHEKYFLKAEKRYGVKKEIIAAIIGIESAYGRYYGTYNVLEALSTLAFDGPERRRAFFKKELGSYFLMLHEHPDLQPEKTLGSYAGAMGWIQFMPSSFRAYAQDGNNDGVIDIWNQPSDMIFSVANYFKKHHFQKGLPLLFRVRYNGKHGMPKKMKYSVFDKGAPVKSKFILEDWKKLGFWSKKPIPKNQPLSLLIFPQKEQTIYFLSTKNFYAISRYNPDIRYTSVVSLLSSAL